MLIFRGRLLVWWNDCNCDCMALINGATEVDYLAFSILMIL